MGTGHFGFIVSEIRETNADKSERLRLFVTEVVNSNSGAHTWESSRCSTASGHANKSPTDKQTMLSSSLKIGDEILGIFPSLSGPSVHRWELSTCNTPYSLLSPTQPSCLPESVEGTPSSHLRTSFVSPDASKGPPNCHSLPLLKRGIDEAIEILSTVGVGEGAILRVSTHHKSLE
jgi:hypothetical protein